MEVIDRLRALAAKEFSIEQSALDPDTPLASLHIDSLAFIDFMFKVESEFDIRVPDDLIGNMRTIGDLERSVCELVAATPES